MSKSVSDLRREYGDLSLDADSLSNDPFVLFSDWLEMIIKTDNYDPTAMVLSTIDPLEQVDSRVVLLKEVDNESFIFYTNYSSSKSIQISSNNKVALNFFWPVMSRQIRIKGLVHKVSDEKSDAYFKSRPQLSQIAAVASPQSKIIDSRLQLENKVNMLIKKYGQKPIIRPNDWGGYAVTPTEIEFWQGRDNRLHDRFLYKKDFSTALWSFIRLAP